MDKNVANNSTVLNTTKSAHLYFILCLHFQADSSVVGNSALAPSKGVIYFGEKSMLPYGNYYICKNLNKSLKHKLMFKCWTKIQIIRDSLNQRWAMQMLSVAEQIPHLVIHKNRRLYCL